MRHTFRCLTVDFPVENCECSNLPLTGSKVPHGWGSFKQITGVAKMGTVSKMIRRGGFAFYVIVRGNVILYVSFCYNRLYLFVYLKCEDLKYVQTCLTFSYVVFCTPCTIKVFVTNKCTIY